MKLEPTPAARLLISLALAVETVASVARDEAADLRANWEGQDTGVFASQKLDHAAGRIDELAAGLRDVAADV